MNTVTTWRFSPLDTWFFRESRPYGTVGGSELDSLFPPPPRTLAGALRTLMGERAGVDWAGFARAKGDISPPGLEGLKLKDAIGFGDDLGPLSLRGPWLVADTGKGPQRLYPAPAFLLGHKEGDKLESFGRLRIGDACECDLGNVRLPVLEDRRFKPLEGYWLTAEALTRVLAGDNPLSHQVIESRTLFDREPRLGIARVHDRRTVEPGMLYQTRHIRPRSGVALEVDLEGADSRLLPDQGEALQTRLGGEGRMALVERLPQEGELPEPPRPGRGRGLILMLLTPAKLTDWLPANFRLETGSTSVWKGEIADIPLTLRSAVLGKPVREGGWDLAANTPRQVHSLLPAGSAWYCTVEGEVELARAIETLHGAHIGAETELGRGQLAVGLWNDDNGSNRKD